MGKDGKGIETKPDELIMTIERAHDAPPDNGPYDNLFMIRLGSPEDEGTGWVGSDEFKAAVLKELSLGKRLMADGSQGEYGEAEKASVNVAVERAEAALTCEGQERMMHKRTTHTKRTSSKKGQPKKAKKRAK
jgi:hypothetical protein